MFEDAKFYVHQYDVNAEEMAKDYCMRYGTNFEIRFCEDGILLTYEEIDVEKKLPQRMRDENDKTQTRNA